MRAAVWSDQFQEIPLNRPAGGSNESGSYEYTPNDVSVGDLDGDGTYEIILKWEPTNSKDNSQSGHTGNTYLEALEMNGESLWRIDLGQNIRSGAHYTQFMVFDFDGDGMAEVTCKTAPGTKDGTGAYLSDGPAGADDDQVDYSNSSGYILSGPEYLTIFNGITGAEMSTINYMPQRGSVGSWGDNYGNRVDRFVAGVAYLDGEHPSIIMCRGYYTRIVIAAVDFNGQELVSRWTFDTNNGMGHATGKGNHQLSVADVDNDGKQEIIYGALVVDDNGEIQHVNSWGHGDALHVGEFDLDNPGLEIFMPVEYASVDPNNGRPAVVMRDAETGAELWAHYKDGDIGRGVTANIDERFPGAETWASSGLGLYDSKGNVIGSIPSGINYTIFWDGDLTKELLDGTKLDDYTNGVQSRQYTLYNDGAESNNGTKANPALQADILGDWREELIYRHYDNTKLLVFTTNFETNYGMHTLMHDPQYRTAIAWQNSGYNQPPHPSFFLGENHSLPNRPNIELIGDLTPKDCSGDEYGTAYRDDCGVCVAGNTGLQPCEELLEAEDACEYVGVIESNNAGFSGAGFVNTTNELGVSVSWVLHADATKNVDLIVRFANGGTLNRDAQVIINGTEVNQLSLPTTGSWTTWADSPIELPVVEGYNTVEFVAVTPDGLANLDFIALPQGVKDGMCLITGVAPTKNRSLQVYPNPVSSQLALSESLSWVLINSSGIELLSGQGAEIQMDQLPVGLYMVKTAKGSVVVQKQ